MLLRSIEPSDIDAVLAMNAADVDKLAPLTPERLNWIVSMSRHALVADDHGSVAGFVMTLPPGAVYDSHNYAWFSERYSDFTYLDRIIVSSSHRRRGVAGLLYDRVEADAAGSRVLLEVNWNPPNHPSLAFHAARGYVELDRYGKAVMYEKPVSAPR